MVVSILTLNAICPKRGTEDDAIFGWNTRVIV